MPLELITELEDRQSFLNLLTTNPGLIIVKLGAEWCKPCKSIEGYVKQEFDLMPNNIQCVLIDVDKSIDLYAYLKNKKMINGIPAILCYYKGNTSFIPDDAVLGANTEQIKAFFDRCLDKSKSI
jgi:thiol-disulfide isomerase/thioredoxin